MYNALPSMREQLADPANAKYIIDCCFCEGTGKRISAAGNARTCRQCHGTGKHINTLRQWSDIIMGLPLS